MFSNRHLHGNLGVGIVALDLEVLKLEVLDVLHLPLDDDLGEGSGRASQLSKMAIYQVDFEVGKGVMVEVLIGQLFCSKLAQL